MKSILFLLIGFFCLANSQQKMDSVQVVELAKVLQDKTDQNKKLMQENKRLQKENENLMEIVLLKVKNWISRKNELSNKEKQSVSRNKEGTKAENRNDPVEEIEVPDGVDSIRGGWVYRLFHQNEYYLKRYKIVNNEKVYLD